MINQRETDTNSGTPISAGNLVQERENEVREYQRRKELCSEIDDDKRNILTINKTK
jgi:hypothetical protein